MIGHLLETEPHKILDVMLVILENCGPAAQSTIPALHRCMIKSNPRLQMSCARTLWLLDIRQAEAIRPVIRESLTNWDAGIRIEAASLLWRLDKSPIEVVPALCLLPCRSPTAQYALANADPEAIATFECEATGR